MILHTGRIRKASAINEFWSRSSVTAGTNNRDTRLLLQIDDIPKHLETLSIF